MWILSPDVRNFPLSMKLVQDKTLEHEELGLKNSKQTNKNQRLHIQGKADVQRSKLRCAATFPQTVC